MTPVASVEAFEDGQMEAFQVNGVAVLLCRVAGEFYAVSNRCSHASQPLHEGTLSGTQLTCPLHGARFDVRSGACLAAPASRPIKSFPVTVEAGKVYVEVKEEDRPRKPQFGPLY